MQNKLGLFRFTFLIFVGLLTQSFGDSGKELGLIREIARSILNQKPGSFPNAYCEITYMRPTNACSTMDRLDSRMIVRQDGSLEWIRYRSWAETYRPAPGEFSGRISTTQWKDLLTTFSQMKWVEHDILLPAPGHSETYTELTISDGKLKASYSIAGSGPENQDLISNGFDQISMLGKYATDTLWALYLVPVKSKRKQGNLSVDAKWVIRGQNNIELSTPSNPNHSSCGTTNLAWYYDGPKKPGMSPLFLMTQYVQAMSDPIPNAPWVKVDSNTPSAIKYEFSLPEELRNEKMAGKLQQLGVLVKVAGSKTPINIALFSDSFSY